MTQISSPFRRVRCERCGKPLKAADAVWLELNGRTETYHAEAVPANASQGGFPFGRDCATATEGRRLHRVGRAAL